MNEKSVTEVMLELTEDDYAAIESAYAEMSRAEDRYDALALTHVEDVRALYNFAVGGTGVAEVIRQVLLGVHHKEGQVHLHHLHRLDVANGARVLRLIERFQMPSLLPDTGLVGILTNAQIEMLLSDSVDAELKVLP